MERRVRTFWTMRERYRTAGRIAAACGAAAGLAVALILGWRIHALGQALDRHFVALAAMLLLAGGLLPYGVVRLLWRRYRNRHLEDIG
jgi:high-affinity Fe2+/Pb2+ permease